MAIANTITHQKNQVLGRIPRASMLLTFLAVVINISIDLRIDLLYDRSAIGRLELWRLVTCHWVHLSWDHLFWSAMTFCVLGSVCEILDKKKYYTTVAISVIFIPAAIWWSLPDLMTYGGLSGLDCAIYALMFTLLINREKNCRNRRWLSLYSIGLVGLLAKVTCETATGQAMFASNTHTNMIPVPLSHLAGGLVGVIVGLWNKTLISQWQAPVLSLKKCRLLKAVIL